MPVPAPPRMNDGRTMIGKPIASPHLERLVRGRAQSPTPGPTRPISVIASLKRLAVLGGADRLGLGADELDAVLVQDAWRSASCDRRG